MDTLVNVNFADVRGKRLLVALSGGADSTALLRLLADRRDSDALFIAAAHFNHCIRGEDADADEAFCRALCAELNVPFFCERADVPAIAAERRLGFETCARELRYAFLRRVCARERMDRIALAHHADDQAETVLMHLLRGAGPEGICGMPRFSGDLYRPLLNARHRDLIAYLRSIGAKWREDATNALPDSPRNALRLNVLPEIEKNYPTAVRAICRYAESAQIESDHLARQTEDFLRSRLSRGAYGQRLTIREGDEEAILRRAMRQICGSRLNAEKLGELIALTRETRGRISVFSDLDAERVPDALYFLPKPAKKPAAVPLAVPGETCLTGVCRIEAENGDFAIMRGDPSIEVVDADAMPNAVLRTWTQGDRMRALGAPGSRLLSDCMIDRHIDRPLRAYLPVIADGKNVLWAQGIGIAEEIKLQPTTRRRLRLQIKTYETDDVEANYEE